jgi:16S rRNA (adenine1518-N6/adenine1519-N6)-dimethyltransferase
MCPIRAKKSLGQHFLANRKYAERIVSAIDPKPSDTVLEIGPGKGALTRILLEKGCRVIAVEVDDKLVEHLKSEFANIDNLKIISNDFLDLDVSQLPSPIKIIGNIPYNITKEILEKLFEFENIVTCVVLTIQTEIAQKLVAKPSADDYGLLTLLIQSGFTAQVLLGVPRKVFSPPPKVSSKVIKLTPVQSPNIDSVAFRDFLRGCFKQKRKTLANSMQFGLAIPKSNCESLLKQAGHNGRVRPELLSLNEYLTIFQLLQKQI